MKQPSIYLKMKVLGAIEVAPGKTRDERTRNVATMTFLDEQGEPRQFTWRTIQTWYYRYKNHGITSINNQSRADKGKPRKVTPEEVLEAVRAAAGRTIDIDVVNRVLLQPHWQSQVDLTDF